MHRLLRLMTALALILGSVLLTAPAFADDLVPSCPNANPCPDGSCYDSAGDTSDGGGRGKNGPSKGKVVAAPSSSSGDPVEVAKGTWYSEETDFAVPVKHGLELAVRRNYSSNYLINGDNADGQVALGFTAGNNWHLNFVESSILQPVWRERSLQTTGTLPEHVFEVDCANLTLHEVLDFPEGYVRPGDTEPCHATLVELYATNGGTPRKVGKVLTEDHILYFQMDNGNVVHFQYDDTFVAPYDDAMQRLRDPFDSNWNQPVWVSRFVPIGSGFQPNEPDASLNAKNRQVNDDVEIYILHTYSTSEEEPGQCQNLPFSLNLGQTFDPPHTADSFCYQDYLNAHPGFSPYAAGHGSGFYVLAGSVSINLYNAITAEQVQPNLSEMGIDGYVVRYSDGRQYHFDDEGRLRFYDLNWRNNTEFDSGPSTSHVDDYLEITWGGNDRPSRMKAPPSDGRYIDYNYTTYNSRDVLTSVDFYDGATTHDNVVKYAYHTNSSSDGYGRLKYVYNELLSIYGVQYDYGYFDPSNGSVDDIDDVYDPDPDPNARPQLCRIAWFQPSTLTVKPTNGFQYNYDEVTSGAGLNSYPTITAEWVLDPNSSNWRKAMSISTTYLYSRDVVYEAGEKEDGTGRYDGLPAGGIVSSVDKRPRTIFNANYSRDIKEKFYPNSSMQSAGTRIVYLGEDLVPGNMYDLYPTSRLAERVERYVGQAPLEDNDWITTKEYTYVDPESGIGRIKSIKTYDDFTVTNVMGDDVYAADPASAILTAYEYHGTFLDLPTKIAVLTSSTDYATTFYTYDSYGRAATVQQKHWDGTSTRTLSTVTYTYATSGPDNGLLLEVETVTPLETHTVEYTYDSKGRAIVVETEDDTFDYSFDGFGNTVVSASDDLITTNTWSTSGGTYFMPPRLLNVTDSAGQDTDYAYTIYNKLYTVTDALSQVTTFTYDNQGNTKTVAAPSQGTVTYIYDIYGKLVQLTDANSNVTKYRYDEFGRQVLESAMDGGSPLYEIGYEYGLSGGGCGSCGTGGGEEQLRRRFIRNGLTTDSLYFEYDFAGRMIGMGVDSDADDVIYAYDSNRRLTSITHANGSALWGNNLLGYAYDDRGRVVKETYPNGRTIEFSYDSNDRAISIKDPFGYVTQIFYDGDNRPDSYFHSSLGNPQLSYDTDDRLTQLELGNGAYSQFNYDAHGRLEEVINRDGYGVDLLNQAWSYDALGRKDASADIDVTALTATDKQLDITYDTASRLTRETYKTKLSSSIWDVQYGYDAGGNRTSVNDGTINKTIGYGAGNRETSVSGGGTALSYDFRGNVTSRTPLAGGNAYTYTWDKYDRLASAARSGQTTVNYTYDAMGRLGRRSGDDKTLNYWLGLNRLAVEKLRSGADESLTVYKANTEASGSPASDGWTGSAGTTLAYDTDLQRGKVARLTHATRGYYSLGDVGFADFNPNATAWDLANRPVLGLWFQSGGLDTPWIEVHLETSAGYKELTIILDSGTDCMGETGNRRLWDFMGGSIDYAAGGWHYIELDLLDRLQSFIGGATITKVNGISFYGRDLYIDDIIVSAGKLNRSYQLTGRTLGTKIGEQRGFADAYVAWYYAYNELGTVVAATGSNAMKLAVWAPDYFGNYRTAVHGSGRPEIGLTGKPWDVEAGLYYFNARWLDPERSGLLSKDGWLDRMVNLESAPNLAIASNNPKAVYPYHFSFNDPANNSDLDGYHPGAVVIVGGTVLAAVVLYLGAEYFDAGAKAKRKSECVSACAFQTMNNEYLKQGMDAPYPKYQPKTGAPASCDTVLCRAAEALNDQDFGAVKHLIKFWNTYCAGPNGAL